MAAKHVLECVECRTLSGDLAYGWLAIRCEDPEKDEPPEIAFYCPVCAWAEFDAHIRPGPLTD